MAFAPYATLPEFKAWVTLTDTVDDVVMSGILESVSEWIDNHTGTHFWQDGTVGTPVARTFIPSCQCGCQRELDIDDLVSVTTLKTDATGDGTFETTWSASDFQLQPVNRPTGEPYMKVEAVGTLVFPMRTVPGSRADRVEITGVWGWAAVPAPVKQACLEQANRELSRRFSPQGVAGFGDFGAIRVPGQLDPDVGRNLDDYKPENRRSGTGVLVA